MALNQVALRDLVPAINFDFERFSLSSRETHLVATLELGSYGLVGWPLLKSYYSSFFAAHAVMRARGVGIVKLDSKHVKHLNDIASLYDPSIAPIESGMFKYRVEGSVENRPGEVSLILDRTPPGPGVHEGFWLQFCSFLEAEAAQAVRNNLPDAALFVAGANELSAAIKNGGSGSGAWLSAIRNEINYQHMYDAWFPTNRKSLASNVFLGGKLPKLESIQLVTGRKTDVVRTFVETAVYISNLSFAVSEYAAERSTVGNAFGQKWRRLRDQVQI